jgi:hypothetical protein
VPGNGGDLEHGAPRLGKPDQAQLAQAVARGTRCATPSSPPPGSKPFGGFDRALITVQSMLRA